MKLIPAVLATFVMSASARYYENLEGGELQLCSTDPMTGYYRDGYCKPWYNDYGKHILCAKMNKDFLDYTASVGNDLRSVVKEGESWCLCEERWFQAYKAGHPPIVRKEATYNHLRGPIREAVMGMDQC